jgi:hypothetical protein
VGKQCGSCEHLSVCLERNRSVLTAEMGLTQLIGNMRMMLVDAKTAQIIRAFFYPIFREAI